MTLVAGDLAAVVAIVLECGLDRQALPALPWFQSKGVPACSWVALSSTASRRSSFTPSTLTRPTKSRGTPEKMMVTLSPVPHPGHFDGLVEAGGVEAAQAVANLGRIQRNTRLLRQLAGQRLQQICAYPLEGDAHHLQARPVEQQTLFGILRRRGERAVLPGRARSGKKPVLSTSEPTARDDGQSAESQEQERWFMLRRADGSNGVKSQQRPSQMGIRMRSGSPPPPRLSLFESLY